VVLVEAADASMVLAAVTVAAAGVMYWSKLHPFWVLAAGAVVGAGFGAWVRGAVKA